MFGLEVEGNLKEPPEELDFLRLVKTGVLDSGLFANFFPALLWYLFRFGLDSGLCNSDLLVALYDLSANVWTLLELDGLKGDL